MGQNNVSIFTNIVQSKQVGETTSEQNTSQLAYLDLSCLHQNTFFPASPHQMNQSFELNPCFTGHNFPWRLPPDNGATTKLKGLHSAPDLILHKRDESQISQACASQWLDWREFFHTYIVCECECVWPNGRENDKVIYTLPLSLSVPISHIDSLPFRSQLPTFKPSQSQTRVDKAIITLTMSLSQSLPHRVRQGMPSHGHAGSTDFYALQNSPDRNNKITFTFSE